MVQQIRDARIKVTVDTEEAKRDIDLLRKSIGKETTSVGHVKSETKTAEKKLDTMMKSAQKAKNKAGRMLAFVGIRGMRTPDLYSAGINAAAAASGLLVSMAPIVGPPLGAIMRTITRTALPFAEYGGTFMGEFLKGALDAGGFKLDELFDKIPDYLKPMMPGGVPYNSDMAIQILANTITVMSGEMTQLRIAQANFEMMLKNVGTMAQTDLAMPNMQLSQDFLKNALRVEWQVGDASNSFRMSMEKTMRGRMGAGFGKVVREYFFGNMQRGQ